jgi:hypothetical protein
MVRLGMSTVRVKLSSPIAATLGALLFSMAIQAQHDDALVFVCQLENAQGGQTETSFMYGTPGPSQYTEIITSVSGEKLKPKNAISFGQGQIVNGSLILTYQMSGKILKVQTIDLNTLALGQFVVLDDDNVTSPQTGSCQRK